LFLRDADHPRSFSDALALRFNTTGAVECQKVSTDETSVAVVKGATLVSGALPLPISQAGLSSLSDRCADGQEEWQHDFHADEPTDAATPGRLAQCVYDRSARHLKTSIEFIEPYRKKRFQESRCQDCGAVEFIDTRRRLKTDSVLTGGPEKAERPSPIPSDIQTSPLDDDFDRGRIEDRLWALGAGRIHELGILRDLSPVGNFNEALWNLCVSGHIDFEGMERDDLGGSWSTTPPTLIQHPRGFRLVGHRSSRVLQSLAKLLQRADVALQEHTPADRAFFSDVFVPTVDVDQMQQLLRTISGELGENPYNISLAGDLPNRFLESLPSLDRLVKQLPTCSYVDVSGHTEVFDLSSIRWTRKSTVSLVGKAIKEPLRGTTYFYVRDGDPMGYQAVSCGYRLAKHLAAFSNRTSLVSYDKENSELVTPLGAELPLLYSRGVIFRTGHLPFKRGARRVYPNVDVGTAEIIEQQFSTTHP